MNVEFYYEKTKYTMYVSIVGAGLNIFLNYIMIPQYGYAAAGYTTMVCYILFAAGHYALCKVLLHRNGVVKNVFNSKMFFAVSCVLALWTFALNWIYPYIWLRYCILGIVFVCALNKRKKLALLFGLQ